MTWADRIVDALGSAGEPLDDDALAERVGAGRRQTINQECRRLAEQGRISRRAGPSGKIVNALADTIDPPVSSPWPPTTTEMAATLTEDAVKAAVRDHLERVGWKVNVAWGHARGTDIEAHRNGERLCLEAKGEDSSDQKQGNYFLGALGELLQRMDDPAARYGLALPDNRRYRGSCSGCRVWYGNASRWSYCSSVTTAPSPCRVARARSSGSYLLVVR
jgi:hypothetical protein